MRRRFRKTYWLTHARTQICRNAYGSLWFKFYWCQFHLTCPVEGKSEVWRCNLKTIDTFTNAEATEVSTATTLFCTTTLPLFFLPTNIYSVYSPYWLAVVHRAGVNCQGFHIDFLVFLYVVVVVKVVSILSHKMLLTFVLLGSQVISDLVKHVILKTLPDFKYRKLTRKKPLMQTASEHF